MKFKPSLKSTRASILVAITIATSIFSHITPSLADIPNRIIGDSGSNSLSSDIAIFNSKSQSFQLGCPALRDLFKMPTQKVSPAEYRRILSDPSSYLSAQLFCNTPTIQVAQGYTSPAFPPGMGVIVRREQPLYVKTPDRFFSAMRITPISLNLEQGNEFIRKNQRLRTNTVLEVVNATIPVPPVNNQQMTVTVINRGAYVAKYKIGYFLNGGFKTISSGDLTATNRFTFFIPGNATQIRFDAELYTGVITDTKIISTQFFENTHNNVCFTTRGTTFKSSIDKTCN